MLRQQTPKPSIPTVKLFPRLAPTVTTTQVRIERSNKQQYQTDGAQIRARLLRMILDNERSRRHDQRPNAG